MTVLYGDRSLPTPPVGPEGSLFLHVFRRTWPPLLVLSYNLWARHADAGGTFRHGSRRFQITRDI